MYGQAHSEFTIENQSLITGTGIQGVIGFIGPTEMGPVGVPTLIGSLVEYNRVFGGLLSDTDFPLYCRRALEAGAKLRVCRAGHYSDIDDASTLAGVKATITLGSAGNTAVFTAKNIGAWANGCVITATTAASGIAGRLDISFVFPGKSDMNQIIRNVKATGLTTDDKTKFNAESQYVDIGTTAGTLTTGMTATLASGAQVRTDIVALDIVGSTLGRNGFYCFDETKDIIKLCAPSYADNDIDLGLQTYVELRKDIMGITRTPIGVDDAAAVQYRQDSTINSWRMLMTTNGLRIKHPTSGIEMNISEIADVAACFSRRDNLNEEVFFSAAGPQLGVIKNTLGVVYNTGTASRSTNGDNLVANGINPVIDHEQFGTVFWGNRTLTTTEAGTLLEKLNVAEMIVRLFRDIKPLIDISLFRPNDPSTWKDIYRKMREYMLTVQEKRGVYDWVYQGDQDVTDITQVQVNNSNSIANGEYHFRLFVKPISAMEYVGIKIVINNSNVDYEAILQN